MKKLIVMGFAGVALLAGPAFAAEGMKHDTAMCEKHCNIMDLQKKVDGLKAQQSSTDKTATKEHLKSDIEAYEKKLEALKTQLDAQ